MAAGEAEVRHDLRPGEPGPGSLDDRLERLVEHERADERKGDEHGLRAPSSDGEKRRLQAHATDASTTLDPRPVTPTMSASRVGLATP